MSDLDLATAYVTRCCTDDADAMLLALGLVEAAPVQRPKAQRRKRLPYGSQGCGTRAGFQRHRDRGTSPCEPCQEAQRTYMAEYQLERYTPERRRAAYDRAVARGYYARVATA